MAERTQSTLKVLVTGGAGFIGSAVVRFLLQQPLVSVVNVDKLTYAGNLDSLASVAGSSQYSFVQVDICDRPQLKRVFAQHRPDAVMNLAAESHVDRSIDSPDAFLETNLVGTGRLLASRARRTGQSSTRSSGSANFAFCTCPRTRSTATWPRPIRRFARRRRTRRARLTRRRRPAPTIWSGRGANLQTAGAGDELLEQLRSVPVSGEADPAHDL